MDSDQVIKQLEEKKKKLRALAHEIKDIEFKLIDLSIEECSEHLGQIGQIIDHNYKLLK